MIQEYNIFDYIERANWEKAPSGHHANKVAFFDNGTILIQKTIGKFFDISKKKIVSSIKINNELTNLGVNVARVFDFYIENKSYSLTFDLYSLQEQAPGVEIQKLLKSSNQKDIDILKQLSTAPQKLFDKYVEDALLISQKMENLDNNMGNLFYDKKTNKITFIDQDKGEGGQGPLSKKQIIKNSIKQLKSYSNRNNKEVINAIADKLRYTSIKDS